MINVMCIFIFVNWDTLVPWAYQLCCLPSINNNNKKRCMGFLKSSHILSYETRLAIFSIYILCRPHTAGV